MRNMRRYQQILNKQVEKATGPAVEQPKTKAPKKAEPKQNENPFVKRKNK